MVVVVSGYETRSDRQQTSLQREKKYSSSSSRSGSSRSVKVMNKSYGSIKLIESSEQAAEATADLAVLEY